nr:hypothetical protein [uncultured Methanoregula sp.]
MKLRYKIVIIFILAVLLFLLYVHLHGIRAGQSTLQAYPITLYPNGSGTSLIWKYIDKTQIENATHLTDRDFEKYPALAEVLTGERSIFRYFSKMGGVDQEEFEILWKQYNVSEYKGEYYFMLPMRH